MSAANNAPKAGGKACGSPDEYYEDEFVTLLQYPFGDSMEKGYCYELFGQWSSSSASTARPPAAVGSSKASATVPATCTYSEMASLSRSESASVSNESGTCIAKDRGECSPSLSRATSADGALALGAERAAGLASQNGRDEFSKVRTSLQPPAGSQLSPFSAPPSVSLSEQSIHSGNVVTHSLFTGKLSPAVQCGVSSLSKPSHGIPSYGTTVSSGLASIGGKSTMSSSACFTAFKTRNSSAAPLQMPSAQESGCSRMTDEISVRRASDYSNSCGQLSTGQSLAVMPARFAPFALEPHAERAAVHGIPDMTLAATSGRSFSGTTLSGREASSNSGKRKLDDSESQSEDVEGESSADARQPRKLSSSKRNRAAEVHNLSERNRRNRINEKLKALQDLIPNSSKTDKASVLDEAIEYMKALQMQLQMVSMRSGLNVSPMMIPLGMPHLQMAPLHPVGLGVPVGHPGLGMGMGMGMVDLRQGMPTRPPQPASVSPNLFSIPTQVRGATGLQECSLDFTNTGSTPLQFMPLSHSSSQVHAVSNSSPQVHAVSNSLPNMNPRQQQDQWQFSRQHSEGRETFSDQVGKEK